eukprot:272348_1
MMRNFFVYIVEKNPEYFDSTFISANQQENTLINKTYLDQHKHSNLLLRIPDNYPPHLLLKEEPFSSRLPPFSDARYIAVCCAFRELEKQVDYLNVYGVNDAWSVQTAHYLDELYQKLWRIYEKNECLGNTTKSLAMEEWENVLPTVEGIKYGKYVKQYLIWEVIMEGLKDAVVDESETFDFSEDEVQTFANAILGTYNDCFDCLSHYLNIYRSVMTDKQEYYANNVISNCYYDCESMYDVLFQRIFR